MQSGANTQTVRQPVNWTALILLGAPAIYLTAFAHEWAYANAFGYPADLISIQVPSLIGSLFAVLGAFVGVFAYFHPVYLFARRVRDPLWSSVLRLAIILLFDFMLFRIFSHHLLEWGVYAAIATVLAALLLFALPMLQRVTGYRAKLSAHANAMRNSSDIWDDIASRIGRSALNLAFALVLAVAVSYWVGRADALDATKYLVTNFQGTEMIILRTYANEIVMTPKAHPVGRLSGSFAVSQISDSHPLLAQERNVGPLLKDCSWGFGCH